MSKTNYFEGLPRGEAPFSVYPRPQMVRNSYICLNGTWAFDFGSSEPAVYAHKITVPYPPESKLSGIGETLSRKELLCAQAQKAKLFYKRTFSKPQTKEAERVLLHFGAVDNEAEVFVNGKKVGSHVGGYLPFSFDITDFLTDGENECKVWVSDQTDPAYPYGKQRIKRGGMWYTPISGIWQTVFLECVPEKHISDVRYRVLDDVIEISVLGGEEEKTLILEDEEHVFRGAHIALQANRFDFWSPANPKLYNFTVKSGKDEVRSYFARRTVKITDGQILVNQEKTFFHGLLDQGYHPDGIFLPPDEKTLAEDILKAKELGFNMLRKHIKVEPQIFYYLCDKIGMFVFQDMVNSGKYSFLRDTALPTVGFKKLPDSGVFCRVPKKTRDFFIEHSAETINHLSRHPSVVYYTIFNEGWGQFYCDEVFEKLKALDPTRVYDATSGWFFGKKSDVLSLHVYFKKFKMPRNSKGRPVILSEFGGYSLPIEGHRFNSVGNYGYKTFNNREAFEEALLALYDKEILPALKNGLSGTVYTQLFDVEDETNGLYTYDRKVCKVTPEKMRALSNRLFKEFENQ